MGILGQGFPQAGAPICDPDTGQITDQWLALLTTLLSRTGGTAPIPATLPQAAAQADMGAWLALLSDVAEPPAPAPGRLQVSFTATPRGARPRARKWARAGGVVHAEPGGSGAGAAGLPATSLPSQPAYEFAGVSTQAAAPGAPVLAAEAGLVVEPTWAWTPGQPVFAGTGGSLTQAPPASGVLHQVGVAASATALLVQPLYPITRQ